MATDQTLRGRMQHVGLGATLRMRRHPRGKIRSSVLLFFSGDSDLASGTTSTGWDDETGHWVIRRRGNSVQEGEVQGRRVGGLFFSPHVTQLDIGLFLTRPGDTSAHTHGTLRAQ